MNDNDQLPLPFSDGSGGGNKFNWDNFAGGVGSIAGGLWNMFGAEDPYESASKYYNQIPGMLNNIYNPYIQNGMNAYGDMGQYQNNFSQYSNRGNQAGNMLMGQYGQMINNPSALLNRLGSGFNPSPGYNFQVQQALGAANRAAAAGGMAGTPAEQQQIAGVTNQLANQDYYNYLNHAQGIYGQGIYGLQGSEGLGLNSSNMGSSLDANIYGRGSDMSNNLANNLGAAMMNQGNLAFSGTVNNNDTMGNAIGAIAGTLPFLF